MHGLRGNLGHYVHWKDMTDYGATDEGTGMSVTTNTEHWPGTEIGFRVVEPGTTAAFPEDVECPGPATVTGGGDYATWYCLARESLDDIFAQQCAIGSSAHALERFQKLSRLVGAARVTRTGNLWEDIRDAVLAAIRQGTWKVGLETGSEISLAQKEEEHTLFDMACWGRRVWFRTPLKSIGQTLPIGGTGRGALPTPDLADLMSRAMRGVLGAAGTAASYPPEGENVYGTSAGYLREGGEVSLAVGATRSALTAELQETARVGDTSRFVELVTSADWSFCSPPELLDAVYWAQAQELFSLARDLIQKGLVLFPSHQGIQRAAKATAPPIVRRVASTPTEGLAASHRWILEHGGQYRGLWVAVSKGELLGAAEWLRDLGPLIDEAPPETLVTKVL